MSELVVLAGIAVDQASITLQQPLQHSYDRKTLTINANVVCATHGETVQEEVLGSGDGSQANQRFTLRQKPLTYLAGEKSTLTVSVDGVAWQEVKSLYDQDSRARCYTVQHNDDGSTTLIFGDGEHGARLPSGSENVRASYRSGSGQDGMVAAGQVTLLQNRPLGIREVSNPLPASGAASAEAYDHARTTAPLTARTLDRVVSLNDFADVARSFASIARAQATQLWDGEQRLVYITIAGSNGTAVDAATTDSLAWQIAERRAPGPPVRIESCELLTFNLAASVQIDPAFQTDTVIAHVKKVLLNAFSFAQRDFGQGVSATQVIMVIQAVRGVTAVDLDKLHIASQESQLLSFLAAKPARREASELKPAQLLMLNENECKITQV